MESVQYWRIVRGGEEEGQEQPGSREMGEGGEQMEVVGQHLEPQKMPLPGGR